MELELAERVPVAVLARAELAARPRWKPTLLSLGPYGSAREYDRHLAATVGSYFAFGDEFRFDAERRLSSLRLTAAEENLLGDSSRVGPPLPEQLLERWLDAPTTWGTLRLVPPTNHFHVEVAGERRHLDERRDLLLCLGSGAAGDGRRRLRVATDVELLFAEGRYCGWVLHRPARYLDDTWAGLPSPTEDPAASPLLAAYLSVVTEPLIARMEERDEPALASLMELLARVGQPEALAFVQPRRVLRRLIEEVLETYYDHTPSDPNGAFDDDEASAVAVAAESAPGEPPGGRVEEGVAQAGSVPAAQGAPPSVPK